MPHRSENSQPQTPSSGNDPSSAAGNVPKKRVFFVKFVAPEQEAMPADNSEPDVSAYHENTEPPADDNETPWFWVSVDTPEKAQQIAAASEAEKNPERCDLPMPPPRPAEPEPPTPQSQASEPLRSPEPPPNTDSPASSDPPAQSSPQSTETPKPQSTWRTRLDRLTGEPRREEPSVTPPVRVRRNLEWPE